MFRKKQTYILTINGFSELRLEKTDSTNIIKRQYLSDQILSDNKIDQVQFSYLLNKFLADVEIKDNLLIRYSSKETIFRIKEVKGLKEEDLEGYIKYNLDEFIPFSKEDLSIKFQLAKDQVAVFGIKRDLVEFIEKFSIETKMQNIYLTIFTSEFISFWNDDFEKDFIFFNIEKDFLEYIIIENSKFKGYGLKEIKEKFIKEGQLPDDVEKEIMKEYIENILTKSQGFANKNLYGIGDWTLLNIWNLIIEEKFDKRIMEKPFDVEKYFGGK